ncbi:hypothetical protein Hanom_Chr09g00838251 [Helianthus anomalus]
MYSYYFIMSKLQVLYFTFVSNCRRCPLLSKLTSFVHNVLISYMFCPLGQTKLDFLVKYSYQRVFLSFYIYI